MIYAPTILLFGFSAPAERRPSGATIVDFVLLLLCGHRLGVKRLAAIAPIVERKPLQLKACLFKPTGFDVFALSV
jgi:hypothetical protein